MIKIFLMAAAVALPSFGFASFPSGGPNQCPDASVVASLTIGSAVDNMWLVEPLLAPQNDSYSFGLRYVTSASLLGYWHHFPTCYYYGEVTSGGQTTEISMQLDPQGNGPSIPQPSGGDWQWWGSFCAASGQAPIDPTQCSWQCYLIKTANLTNKF